MSGTIIAMICPKHGFVNDNHCPRCDETKATDTVHINTESWLPGMYEHIDPRGPIHIRDKAQLKEECLKRGLMAKSLMKPKNQGVGYEMR